MKPSSVMSRPTAELVSTSPVVAERPGPGILAQVVRAAILAALLALALGAPGRGSTSATEPETPLTPAVQLLEVPFDPYVAPDPAPAAEVESLKQPAGQAGTGRVAPRQVAPAAPAADAPGGGDTNVTYSNGSNDVDSSSGGSHVNNSANLRTHAGVDSGDPDEEDAGP